jgi:glutamate-1-semialdehyde aminotransferase
MTALGNLDRARIGELHAAELGRFRQARPRTLAMLGRAQAHMPNGVPMAWMASDNDQPVYIDHGQGPGFTDVDGFTYLDFNASDMAMFCGHAHPAIVAGVQAQVARSTQFLLPTEASVEVAEELARRYPVGQWQFTLSATQANTEVIRLARAVTGREVIVLFQGRYHGHFEEGPGGPGRRPGQPGAARLVQGSHRPGADRPVQRPGYAASGARAWRCGAGADRARDDQLHPPAAARTGLT